VSYRGARWLSRSFDKDIARELRDFIEQNTASGNIKHTKESLCQLQDNFLEEKKLKPKNVIRIEKSSKRKRLASVETKGRSQKGERQQEEKKSSETQKQFTKDSSVSSMYSNESDDFKITRK